jgi:kynurenine 3-monooxygenase
MSQTPKKIAVVGSGLVGSLLAIYLKKAGHAVDIYDRRPDIRQTEFSGRSINLAMSVRGWKALEGVGIAEEIQQIAIPMNKRAIHVKDKPMYFQHYGKEGEAIYSISRGVLNRKMVDLAEAEGARFIFNSKVWDVNLPEATLAVGEEDKSTWEYKKYDLIFGADGAFSRVRHRMQRRSRFDYSQKFLNTGYKELTILPTEDGKHKLDKNSLHIWPRGKFMFIALPNLDGSFTCTLFMPFEGEVSFDALNSDDKVRAFFKKYFASVINEIDDLAHDFF